MRPIPSFPSSTGTIVSLDYLVRKVEQFLLSNVNKELFSALLFVTLLEREMDQALEVSVTFY